MDAVESSNNGAVKIGDKPILAYVMAIGTSIAQNNGNCTVVARGKYIVKAVDAVEVAKRNFNIKAPVTVSIGTESINKFNVSTIAIKIGA